MVEHIGGKEQGLVPLSANEAYSQCCRMSFAGKGCGECPTQDPSRSMFYIGPWEGLCLVGQVYVCFS